MPKPAKNFEPVQEVTEEKTRDILRAKYNAYHAEMRKPAEDKISTGIVGLDYILGGGLARGRIVLLQGRESAGKTSLVLQTIKAAQEKGLSTMLVDAEGTVEMLYILMLNIKVRMPREQLEQYIAYFPPEYQSHYLHDLDSYVDMENGLDVYYQTDFAEHLLDLVADSIKTGAHDLIWVDSATSLFPKAEFDTIEEKGMEKPTSLGRQAFMFSTYMRALSPHLTASKTVLGFTRQYRDNVDGMMYGPKEKTSGGRALAYYASTIIEARIGSKIEDTPDHFIGHELVLRTSKHKLFPGPHKTITLSVLNNRGVDSSVNLVELALTHGIVKKSGSWLKWQDVQGQGKMNFADALTQAPDKKEELQQLVLLALRSSYM